MELLLALRRELRPFADILLDAAGVLALAWLTARHGVARRDRRSDVGRRSGGGRDDRGATERALELRLQALERDRASGGSRSWSEVDFGVRERLFNACAAVGWAVMLRAGAEGYTLALYPRGVGEPRRFRFADADEASLELSLIVEALEGPASTDEGAGQG